MSPLTKDAASLAFGRILKPAGQDVVTAPNPLVAQPVKVPAVRVRPSVMAITPAKQKPTGTQPEKGTKPSVEPEKKEPSVGDNLISRLRLPPVTINKPKVGQRLMPEEAIRSPGGMTQEEYNAALKAGSLSPPTKDEELYQPLVTRPRKGFENLPSVILNQKAKDGSLPFVESVRDTVRYVPKGSTPKLRQAPALSIPSTMPEVVRTVLEAALMALPAAGVTTPLVALGVTGTKLLTAASVADAILNPALAPTALTRLLGKGVSGEIWAASDAAFRQGLASKARVELSQIGYDWKNLAAADRNKLNTVITTINKEISTPAYLKGVATGEAGFAKLGKEGAPKEPWQMTREEYLQSVGNETQPRKYAVSQPHESAIRQALSEGKPVPPEVLKDYPDLAKTVKPLTIIDKESTYAAERGQRSIQSFDAGGKHGTLITYRELPDRVVIESISNEMGGTSETMRDLLSRIVARNTGKTIVTTPLTKSGMRYLERLQSEGLISLKNLSSEDLAKITSKYGRNEAFPPLEVSLASKVEPTAIPKAEDWYHGSKQPINKFAISYEAPGKGVENLFGEGLYVTDNPTIAGTYAKSQGTTYKVQMKPDIKLLDLEKPLPTDAQEAFTSFAKYNDQYLGRFTEVDVKKWIDEGMSGADIYRKLVDDIYDLPKSEAIEAFGAITQNLQAKGYEGFSHIGGKYAGKGKTLHNVRILWNPQDAITSKGVFAKVKPIETPKVGVPPVEPPKVAPVQPTGGGAVPPKVPSTGIISISPKVPLVEKAGNIRLEKYPDEVRPLIKEIADNYPDEIAKATRGVRSQAQSLEDAQKMVQEFGEDPKKFIRSPGSSYNAEEIMATKIAHNRAVAQAAEIHKLIQVGQNSTENLTKYMLALQDAANLQKAVYGGTAEMGRGLNILKKAVPEAVKANDQVALEKILKSLGGRATVEEIAKKMAQVDLNNPAQVNSFIRSIVKANKVDLVQFYYINSIMSNPATMQRNILGNLLATLVNPVEKGIAAAVSLPKAFVGKPRARYFGEVPADIYGAAKGFPDGVRAFLNTWKWGISPRDLAKYDARIPAMTGWQQRVFGWPSTMNTAVDAFVYNINQRAAFESLSFRQAKLSGLKGEALVDRLAQIRANPTKELIEESIREADYRLFRGDPSSVAKVILRAREQVPIFKFIIPFVSTPDALIRFGMERSPIGVLSPRLWKDVIKGHPEAADDIGRLLLGSSLAAGIAYYFADGKITGPAPKDAIARDQFYREGKLPYSVLIGDRWISFRGLEPFNQTLFLVSMVVDAVNNKEKGIGEKVNAAVSGIVQNLMNQSYLSGLSDMFDAVSDPATYADKYLRRFSTSFVPFSAFNRAVAQTIDPTIRQAQNYLQEFMANIPGMTGNVPPKVTALGEPSERAMSPLSAIQSSQAQETYFNTELSRLDTNIGFVGSSIKGIGLTPQEKQEYQEISGTAVKNALMTLFDSTEYARMTDQQKSVAIDKAISTARQEGTDQMLQGSISRAHEGDTPQVTAQRQDESRISAYYAGLRKYPENQRDTWANRLRERDPELDVALNIRGYVTTVKSSKAKTLLRTRATQLGIDTATLPALSK